MKTFFIDFILEYSNGGFILSQTLSVMARNVDFASSIFSDDLATLSNTLPRDVRVIYDLSNIYTYGK